MYAANEIRLRVEHFPADGGVNEFGEPPVPSLSGISNVKFDGRYHQFWLDDPNRVQEVLCKISNERTLSHFEVVKPSLHDVFVQIAGPALETESLAMPE